MSCVGEHAIERGATGFHECFRRELDGCGRVIARPVAMPKRPLCLGIPTETLPTVSRTLTTSQTGKTVPTRPSRRVSDAGLKVGEDRARHRPVVHLAIY